MGASARTSRRSSSAFLALWLWSVLGAVAVGAALTEFVILPRVLRATERGVRHEMRLQLEVRGAAIERWIVDALADARTVANFPSSSALLTPGGAARVDPEFTHILTDFADQHAIDAIGVFTPDLRMLAATTHHPFDGEAWQRVGPGLSLGKGDRLGFVPLLEDHGHVLVSVGVPRTNGYVLAVIAPERWLSTLLASRALALPGGRIVLRQADSTGAHAVLGDVAPAGEALLLEERRVPGVPWTMVLSVPRADAFAPVVERTRWWEAGSLVLLAALVSLGFALAWGQRRAVDAAVQRSRARFSLLLEHANDPILFLDDEGVILRCNQRAEEFYGVPTGGLTGRHLTRDLSIGGADGAICDGVHPAIHRAAQGREVAVEVSARRSMESGRAVTVALVRDVQARLEAERQMLELNRQLRTATEIGAAITREQDEPSLVREVLELSVHSGGMCVAAVAAPAPDGGWAWRGRCDSGPGFAGLELPIGPARAAWDAADAVFELPLAADGADAATARLAAAGAKGWLAVPVRVGESMTAVVVFFASASEALQPEARGIVRSVVRDVGLAIESIRERRVRRELEATLQALFESGPIGIATFDGEQRLREANAEFLRILGRSREDVLARPPHWMDFCQCPKGEEAHMPCESGAPFECTFGRADGVSVPVYVARVRLADEHGRSVAVALDLTAQRATSESLRQTQLQLLQAQKMETIGRLAGGVAHDFNNLLTVIQGYTQIVQASGSQSEADTAALAQVLRAAERAAALTRQMLAFSRQQVLEARVLDLGQVLTDTEKMIRRLIGEDIEILLRLPGNLGRVKADPVQVEQVLLNLVVNARDAMPRGGCLTLELMNFEANAEFVKQHPEVAPGEYVQLRVSDDGEGMSPEIMPRIFEPFFTTKESGKGTGLGLATVYGIIRQSGGTIWVNSQKHVGTTFHILLPRVFGEQEGRLEHVQRPRGMGEVVLVVEDDDMVRPITVAMLERLGYHVLSAADADSAMEVSRARTGPIDLLLSDVVMRGRNGPELARDFRRERPGVPVLFVTGYTHDPRTVELLGAGGSPYLSKPFSLDALGQAVRRALTGAGARIA